MKKLLLALLLTLSFSANAEWIEVVHTDKIIMSVNYAGIHRNQDGTLLYQAKAEVINPEPEVFEGHQYKSVLATYHVNCTDLKWSREWFTVYSQNNLENISYFDRVHSAWFSWGNNKWKDLNKSVCAWH